MNPCIVICGAGGIGRAAALILACNETMTPDIYLGDINQESLNESKKWLLEGKSRAIKFSTFLMPLTESNEEMDELFSKADVILDCLPGSQAPRIARLANHFKAHYANLTEYITETNEIIELATDSESGFVLQTGLAPGFINILACQLYNEFKQRFQNDKVDSIKMRVGALSEHALAPHFYAYTWSPIGVATEYIKDAIVVKDFIKQTVPSLSQTDKIVIEGKTYEDDYTSGGAADLPHAFSGLARNLDYKTLRYVGHYEWVKKQLEKIDDGPDKPKQLDKYMQTEIPTVEADKVIIYSQVAGRDQNGVLRALEKAYNIPSIQIGNKRLRAIQATTASALCEAAFLLIRTKPKGVVLQSHIEPLEFINGPYVRSVYGGYSS